ncbi:MAG: hypothetical protein AABX16_02485 [Nanoarchaeota archaeon]
MTKLHDNIDWEKAKEYILNIYPTIQQAIQDNLDCFESVRPYLVIEQYPPRLVMTFIPKSQCDEFLPNTHLLDFQEKEIVNNLERIAEKSTSIAEAQELKISAGDSQAIDGRRFYRNDPGMFNFKPIYKNFEKGKGVK